MALAETKPDSPYLISWDTMTKAQSYRVKVAHDPTLKDLVVEKKLSGTATSLDLSGVNGVGPGTYYFQVSGLDEHQEEVDTTAITALVIGPEVTITASRYAPPPPEIASPASETLWAPADQYRFAWFKVTTADRYRFRIWRSKPSNPRAELLWTTETDKTWIQVRDLPPSSYRQLSLGEYLWDVSAVAGPAGPEALISAATPATVKISREAHLAPSEKIQGLVYETGAYRYKGSSGVSQETTRAIGPLQILSVPLEFWRSRHWGFFIEPGFWLIGLAVSPRLLLGGAYRTYLSDRDPTAPLNKYQQNLFSDGWSFWTHWGLNAVRTVQYDSINHASHPYAIGLKFEGAFNKTVNTFSAFNFGMNWDLPFITTRGDPREPWVGRTAPDPLSIGFKFRHIFTFSKAAQFHFGIDVARWANRYWQESGRTSNEYLMATLFGGAFIRF